MQQSGCGIDDDGAGDGGGTALVMMVVMLAMVMMTTAVLVRNGVDCRNDVLDEDEDPVDSCADGDGDGHAPVNRMATVAMAKVACTIVLLAYFTHI